ncbi:hypothetical protein L4D16_19045 [Vibrio alginolyticus]|uniref:hypothetical protein n=1 Tax=Vibrio alginolyticus TaxID=663 RepID=UPI003BFA47EE
MGTNMSKDNLSLIELKSVRWVIFILLSIGIILTAIISISSDLDWDFSYKGFNLFVEAFSLPITIISAIIPIVGLIALNHRSQQTKVQLDKAETQLKIANAQYLLAQKQNIFTNYYKHIEEYEKYIDKIGLHIANSRESHSTMFPKAKNGDYTPFNLENIGYFSNVKFILDRVLIISIKKHYEIDDEFEIKVRKFENDLLYKVGCEYDTKRMNFKRRNNEAECHSFCLDLIDLIIESSLKYYLISEFESDLCDRDFKSIYSSLLELSTLEDGQKLSRNDIFEVKKHLSNIIDSRPNDTNNFIN